MNITNTLNDTKKKNSSVHYSNINNVVNNSNLNMSNNNNFINHSTNNNNLYDKTGSLGNKMGSLLKDNKKNKNKIKTTIKNMIYQNINASMSNELDEQKENDEI